MCNGQIGAIENDNSIEMRVDYLILCRLYGIVSDMEDMKKTPGWVYYKTEIENERDEDRWATQTDTTFATPEGVDMHACVYSRVPGACGGA